ncbi:MAG: GFA family protein [Caulobacteraceae bacterium]|nr:GFA family protein [Caulobacteraceae bacterium]
MGGLGADEVAVASCACGAVRLEMTIPAVWAWNDHSLAGRRAHGGAYATYVGSWKSRVRLTSGDEALASWTSPDTGAVRRFCRRCGTTVMVERARAPRMVNIPRGLFEGRTGREPRYHLAFGEAPDWAYRSAPLAPLQGYPGVLWERPRRASRDRTRPLPDEPPG